MIQDVAGNVGLLSLISPNNVTSYLQKRDSSTFLPSTPGLSTRYASAKSPLALSVSIFMYGDQKTQQFLLFLAELKAYRI